MIRNSSTVTFFNTKLFLAGISFFFMFIKVICTTFVAVIFESVLMAPVRFVTDLIFFMMSNEVPMFQD